MKQQIQTEVNLNKIVDEIEETGILEIYFDYDDRLSDEQINRLIKEEDYLNDLENEIYINSLDYIADEIYNQLKDYEYENKVFLTDEQKDEIRYLCEERIKMDINQLIKNSSVNIRLELLTNEDMIYYENWEHNDTIKEFRRRFKGCFKLDDLKKEFNELPNDYALITFYFKVEGLDILEFRKQVLSGYLNLRKGVNFGLFNGWVGGGSVLEMQLIRDVVINLNDWRIKNIKEEVIDKLKGNEKSYYSVGVYVDNVKKYSIQETYGLSGEGWVEWK